MGVPSQIDLHHYPVVRPDDVCNVPGKDHINFWQVLPPNIKCAVVLAKDGLVVLKVVKNAPYVSDQSLALCVCDSQNYKHVVVSRVVKPSAIATHLKVVSTHGKPSSIAQLLPLGNLLAIKLKDAV